MSWVADTMIDKNKVEIYLINNTIDGEGFKTETQTKLGEYVGIIYIDNKTNYFENGKIENKTILDCYLDYVNEFENVKKNDIIKYNNKDYRIISIMKYLVDVVNIQAERLENA